MAAWRTYCMRVSPQTWSEEEAESPACAVGGPGSSCTPTRARPCTRSDRTRWPAGSSWGWRIWWQSRGRSHLVTRSSNRQGTNSIYMYIVTGPTPMYAKIKGLRVFSIHLWLTILSFASFVVKIFPCVENALKLFPQIKLYNVNFMNKCLQQARERKIDLHQSFWHKIHYTKKNNLRYAKRILKIGQLLKLRTEWNRTERDAP